ncbi:alkaline ceramidase [Paenibacillus albiflavus]|uniref:Neutral ceramidase n=2 Tax=Paenibacillus albiflavus TaxID=2545760 RepID=A0A4V2WNH3_9BACL|nr:alkaline ceramidase [Paenibacillus albiflavus]
MLRKKFLFTKGLLILALLLSTILSVPGPSAYADTPDDVYNIGAGIYDITGDAAEVRMMGYASTDQITAGIHTRLRSRAFVIGDAANTNRVVFVSADLGIMPRSVTQKVVEKLQAKFGGLYSDRNVLVSSTHTHAGPGGYSHYALYNITILGFIKENFDVIVNGIYQSIVNAHNNMEPGHIAINRGQLEGVSVNRSLDAYHNNPASEIQNYTDDVDKTMTSLNFINTSGQPIGTLNWFALHGTSMSKYNTLISGDNKGYASYLYEKSMNTDYSNTKTFVAAFAQSNEGDVSPNIYGNGVKGYGNNEFESTEYAGRKQYEAAVQLNDTATQYLSGSVDFRHQFVNFENISVAPEYADGTERHTAPAAMGYSFATGAEDGPSDIAMFHEGMTQDDYPFGSANAVSVTQAFIGITPFFGPIVGTYYPELWSLHYPKPILFATSKGQPYPWTPNVLPLQILKIGQLRIIAVPAEFTTMAGRRLINTVQSITDDPDGLYVIAGLSNTYSDYVTTKEEYDTQNYEGASTLFGPWTLAAYQQKFADLAASLKNGTPLDNGPTPIDLSNKQNNFQTGVVFDDVPIGKQFGSIVQNVEPSYNKGDVATVTFWGGHPKNDLKTQSTFLEVQRKDGDKWTVVSRDWDWDTKYIWKRVTPGGTTSQVTIEWNIPQEAASGTYRIVHYGNYKNGWDQKIYPYTGTSSTFIVN